MSRFYALHVALILVASAAGCAHSTSASNGDTPAPAATAVTSEEEQRIMNDAPTEPLSVIKNDTPEGDAFLHAPSTPIRLDDPALEPLISRMRASLEREEGVGIAAPQVGIGRRIIIVQRQDKEGDPLEVYINATIVEYAEERIVGWEGCLSVPAGFGQVERPASIVLAYDGADGTRLQEPVDGWTARIFQHEIDHLDGILFIDRMESPDLLPEDEYREMRLREREALEEAASAVAEEPAPTE